MARQFKDVILFWASQRLASYPHHLNRFTDYLENSWDGFKLDTAVHIIMTDPALTEDGKEKAVITCVRGAVDRWLAKHAQTLEQAPPLDAPARQKDQGIEPVQRQQAQDAAVLKALLDAGYNPEAVPVSPLGLPGVRAQIGEQLKDNPLFAGATIFTKAWQRLRDHGDIKDAV